MMDKTRLFQIPLQIGQPILKLRVSVPLSLYNIGQNLESMHDAYSFLFSSMHISGNLGLKIHAGIADM